MSSSPTAPTVNERPATQQGGRREEFIDATRGVAMVAVLIAHFSWIYFGRHPDSIWSFLVVAMYFASPTFMLTSGIVLGYVHDSRPHRFEAFRIKLIDRGLFLLTIGHVVISLAYIRYAGGLAGAFRSAQILDPIGVSIIVAPLLMSRTSRWSRLLIAMGVFAAGWVAILSWHPVGPALVIVKATLFGGGWWLYNFPIVPWLCLYLVGTCLGQGLHSRLNAGDSAGVRAVLLRLGACGVGLGLALFAGGRMLQPMTAGVHPAAPEALSLLTSPVLKLPPSPAYFFLWGGLGLLLILAVFTVVHRGIAPRAMKLAAIIGQNSLFIFLLQEHLYVLVLWTWNPPYGAYWPILMLATIALSVSATYVWHVLGWSRYLTVGFGRWWGPRVDSRLAAS